MSEIAVNPLMAGLSVVGSDDMPPATLLPYQQRWVADQSPLKVGEKSRRIGFTWGEAADNVLTASKEGGSNVFYISATQDMAIEYIEACAMWARAFHLAAGEIEAGIWIDDGDKEIKTYKIDFPLSGKRIVALSSRPANLRGKQGDIVIDEAAFAPDLAGLIKAAMAMLMWGNRVRIFSTHDGDDNPFNELINQIRSGKRKGTVHRVTFADAVADGLYRRVCLRKEVAWTQEAEDAWVADVRAFYADDAEEELDVIPARGGGTFLPLALIEARMVAPADADRVPVVRKRWPVEFSLLPEPIRAAEVADWCEEHLTPRLAKLDPERRHGFGEDFARIGDLTVIVPLVEGTDLVRRPCFSVELGGCPFAQQRQILTYIVDRLPRFYSGALDAGGNGAELAEYAADTWGHSRIEQVKLSDAFYLEQMPKFKAALEDATLDGLPRDEQCRDDLRALKKINGVPKLGPARTKSADGKALQRHGDYAIALFLGHHAMTREGMPGECRGYESAARRGADDDDEDYPSRRMM